MLEEYYLDMRFEFDPSKDEANQEKHGLSLGLAPELEWEAALEWRDIRKDYGEDRFVALAPTDGVLYFVAYVDRGNVRRIISLRRANRREVARYVEETESPD